MISAVSTSASALFIRLPRAAPAPDGVAQFTADAAPTGPQKSDTVKAAAKLLELSDEEKQQVAELRRRDQEVRRHEQAHASTGGQYAGQPSFEFVRGPDGKQYAVGGEVQIDVSPIADDPEATLRKMQVVKAAALAPAQPSAQDQAIAAQAEAQRLEAQAEINKQDVEAEAEDQKEAAVPANPLELSLKPDLGQAVAAYLASAGIEKPADGLRRPDHRNRSVNLLA